MTTAVQARDRFVTANGLRLHYREWGDARSPTLLIFHGITGHSWEWDTLAAAVAPKFHVLAVDQRGHGASTWTPDYSPDHMAEDVAALMTSLKLRRVRIVGHSMGAINSYLYAARHPASVEGLVIIDAGPETRSWMQGFLPTALEAWARATFVDPEEALREWLVGCPLADRSEMRRYVMPNLRQDDDGLWRWRFDAARLRSFVDQLPDAATQWAALRGVACPTLVIRGGESEALSPPVAARMVQELEGGLVVEVPGAGHDVHIDQPEALVSAVRGFLTMG